MLAGGGGVKTRWGRGTWYIHSKYQLLLLLFFFFQKGGLYLIFLWVSCLTKGDVTRNDSQRRFVAQHSVATSLRHCF